MLDVAAGVIACDLHPDYLATKWAREQRPRAVEVQHHHAHAAACLAEHGLRGPALALVFDGTGYGPDGTLWGGELLRCDLKASSDRPPRARPAAGRRGGDPRAVADGGRLPRARRPARAVPEWPRCAPVLGVNAPLSSGMGRLFDAAAAVLGVRERVSYEGQAAIELEQLAGDAAVAPYPCGMDAGVIAGADLIAALHDDLAAGRPRAQIAAAFHEGVAAAAAAACAVRGRAGHGRALGRDVPEPAPARVDPAQARGARLPGARATPSSRRTTAGSATDRLRWRPPARVKRAGRRPPRPPPRRRSTPARSAGRAGVVAESVRRKFSNSRIGVKPVFG